MTRTVSRSKIRILKTPEPRLRGRAPVRPVKRSRIVSAPAEKTRTITGLQAGTGQLSVRPVEANDLTWVISWTTQLSLPTPRLTRMRSFILMQDGRRIGYMAGRPSKLNLGHGIEPVMWIVGAFLIPSKRGQGLLPRFGAILSRDVFPEGKVMARVAAANTRMHRYMSSGGWRRIRSTRRYTDYSIELESPYSVQTSTRQRA